MKKLLLMLLCIFVTAQVLADVITYPRHQAKHDPQLDYMLSVLKLAVAKSGKTYTLKQASTVMVQSRVIREITDNTGSVDIIWTMTDSDRETEMLPIRIPIDKGLIGWRIALVQGHKADLFSKVENLEDLKVYTAGQMHDWPDTTILRTNGLPVETLTNYEGLFQKVAQGQIDYFPRSVIEVTDELKSHPDLDLAMDRYIVIEYPSAFYFFVSKYRPQLAADLARGMERAVADGSLDRLFSHYYGKTLQQLNLKERRHIRLGNPLLPDATPVNRPELWYRP